MTRAQLAELLNSKQCRGIKPGCVIALSASTGAPVMAYEELKEAREINRAIQREHGYELPLVRWDGKDLHDI